MTEPERTSSPVPAVMTIHPGDLVHVRVRNTRTYIIHGLAKARLIGWEPTPTIGGRGRMDAVVTYTADHGDPFAGNSRVRGEHEKVPLTQVWPRNRPGGSIADPLYVIFIQGREPAYQNAPPVGVIKLAGPTLRLLAPDEYKCVLRHR